MTRSGPAWPRERVARFAFDEDVYTLDSWNVDGQRLDQLSLR